MEQNKILIPVDFTESTEKASNYAAYIATKENMNITFLHVADRKTDLDIENKLSTFSEKLTKELNVKCDYIIREGNVSAEIQSEASKLSYKLMIIGSHGYKGLERS